MSRHKRPYSKRLVPQEPTMGISTRIRVAIYERMSDEAAALNVSMSALIAGVLENEYGDEDAFYERLKDIIAMDERERQHKSGTAPFRREIAQPAEKPAKSIFHESSTFAEDEPFPLGVYSEAERKAAEEDDE